LIPTTNSGSDRVRAGDVEFDEHIPESKLVAKDDQKWSSELRWLIWSFACRLMTAYLLISKSCLYHLLAHFVVRGGA